ncbi:hypothetical protein EAF04_008041 [Stromatinia cepivora]|nr:hypothetical protein EAF04_008041 [Stromatinia cepivora]
MCIYYVNRCQRGHNTLVHAAACRDALRLYSYCDRRQVLAEDVLHRPLMSWEWCPLCNDGAASAETEDDDGNDGDNTGNKRKESKQAEAVDQNPQDSTPAKNTRNQSRKVSAAAKPAMENPRKRRWDSRGVAPEDTAPSEGEETDDDIDLPPLKMKKARSKKKAMK